MSELDEIVVLLSVEKYKSLLDLENERREFEEYKKSEMEKLVSDQINETKKLIKFCNLTWDENCINLANPITVIANSAGCRVAKGH